METLWIIVGFASFLFIIFVVTHLRPLNEQEVHQLGVKRRREEIRTYFSFNTSEFSVNKEIKSRLNPDGKFYQIEESLSNFPSIAAALLKYKKHEWIIVAFEKYKKVCLAWLNKGFDRSSVSLHLSAEHISEIANNNNTTSVLIFHNHPNPDPNFLDCRRPSNQDIQSANAFSSVFNKNNMTLLEFICERGKYYEYYLAPADSFSPLKEIIAKIQEVNGSTKIRNLFLHIERLFERKHPSSENVKTTLRRNNMSKTSDIECFECHEGLHLPSPHHLREPVSITCPSCGTKYEWSYNHQSNEFHLDRYSAVCYKRGEAYFHDNMADEAMVEFKKAIAEDPSYLDAHNALGIIYLAQKKFKEALTEFEKASALIPPFEKKSNKEYFTAVRRGFGIALARYILKVIPEEMANLCTSLKGLQITFDEETNTIASIPPKSEIEDRFDKMMTFCKEIGAIKVPKLYTQFHTYAVRGAYYLLGAVASILGLISSYTTEVMGGFKKEGGKKVEVNIDYFIQNAISEMNQFISYANEYLGLELKLENKQK